MILLCDSDISSLEKVKGGKGYEVIKGTNIYVHRALAEQALGRKLKDTEQVHHVDYNKGNNSRSNLVICPDKKYHALLHYRTDCINAGFNPDTHAKCSMCKTYAPRELFAKNKNKPHGLHNLCKEHSNTIRKEKQYSKGKFNWLARLRQQYNRVLRGEVKRQISWLQKGTIDASTT